MRKTPKSPREKIVKDIERATRKHRSSDEKIRMALDGHYRKDSIVELCRRKGISRFISQRGTKPVLRASKLG